MITINNGNTLSASVDDFKAVAWWYDKRHETGTLIDDIDLILRRTNGTSLSISNDSDDEKERVYYSSVGGNAVELVLDGFDVQADNVGPCGTNSMLVYYAYFYEDDARDDGDGPTSGEIQAEGAF